MALVNSKSLLAKLLATENISVEIRKVSTAAFDLKDRVLVVPDWEGVSASGYDLLLGHEVSHALNTPYEGWKVAIEENPSLRHFLNVTEDARIEKRIKRKYPGLRRSFQEGYSEFLKKDIFGIKDRDINTMYFVDRLNIHCKTGNQLDITFSAEEDNLVKFVESAETFEDALEAAKAVYAYSVKEQQEENKDFDDSDETADSGGDDSADDETDETGDSYDTAGSASNSNEDGDEYGESSEYSGSQSELPSDNVTEKKMSSNGVDGSGNFVPSCSTDESFEASRESLAKLDGLSNLYLTLPKPDLKKIVTPVARVHDLLRENFKDIQKNVSELSADFKNRNFRYIDLLAKEFEMRKAAKSYAKSKISNAGDIDIGKVYKYRTDDNIFRRVTTTPKGKNHGMVILLDRSGSMSSNMKGSLEQLVIMAQFCKRVGIPFVVYGFGKNSDGNIIDNNLAKPHLEYTMFSKNNKEIAFKNVFLREYLNSKMSNTAFKEACDNIITLAELFGSGPIVVSVEKISDDGSRFKQYKQVSIPPQEDLSSTPLNESLIALAHITKEFKTKNNLEIVSTVIIQDGDADSPSRYYYDDLNNKVHYTSYYNNIIITDKINGKIFQEKLDNNYKSFSDISLKWYSAYTETNVLGLFLMDKRQTRIHTQNLSTLDFPASKVRSELKENRFVVADRVGYNKFFYLVGGSQLFDDSELTIDSDMTVSQIKANFLKNNKKKLTNRSLVTKLIEEISV